MVKVIYQSGSNEPIGNIPYGAKILVNILFKDVDNERALIFMDTETWFCRVGSNEWELDDDGFDGGSISIAVYDKYTQVWVKEPHDNYVNISRADVESLNELANRK